MVKTLRIFCLAAALIAAGILFYTKAVAPGETRDSDVSISLPEEPLEYTSNQEVLGTAVSQSVYGEKAAETIETVNNILYDFSAHWDNTLVDSVPGQVAASAGLEPSVLAEEDYQVIRRAFDLAQQTEGLFDPTVGALTSVWADGEPSADQVSWALTYTGWQEVSLSDEDMSAGIGRPGITLDMGAVVPGMAVQAALEAYQEADIDGGVITMDGAAAMTGTKSEGGESFTIGLRNPMNNDGDHYAVLQADDVVICTADGESRLLNPADGYPVETRHITHARVRRAVLLAALGVTSDEMAAAPPYARILAADAKGAQLLAACKDGAGIPFSSSLAKLAIASPQAKRTAFLCEYSSWLRDSASKKGLAGRVPQASRKFELTKI